jgi:Xaa-Pro aminopeptidase
MGAAVYTWPVVDSLPGMDRRRRLGRLAQLLSDRDADVLVVTRPENVRYLTGFTGTGWAVVRSDGQAALATDPRYRGRAEQELATAGVDLDIHFDGPKAATAVRDLVSSGSIVLLEAEHVTLSRLSWFEEELPEQVITPSTELVENLRISKDEGEVARLARAGEIVAGVFNRITTLVQPGMTERQVARTFDRAVEDAGGQDRAFDTLVASGPNASYPHWTPSDRVIEETDLVLIDGGTIIDGYRSDVTRTFSFGHPAPEAQEILDVATAAYAKVAGSAKADCTYRELDQLARDVITDAGYGDALVHPTGHNVGLTIHEHPFLAVTRDEVVGPNRVVTIEPGVYVAGKFGARLENMFRVTIDGAELLSQSPSQRQASEAVAMS